MTIALGKLTHVPDLRAVWPNEASEFTPWLAQADNLQTLGDELGLELEIVGTEVAVGPYSADILAKETTNDRNVVIENQIEKTNHDHLGKVLTYGALLDASVVVWIAKVFTDEHRKALDWLNDYSSENLQLFGVCIELWRVGESLPAPRFNVVSRPADLLKQARTGSESHGEPSAINKLRLEFWTQVRDKLKESNSIPSFQTPKPRYYYDISLGRTHIHLSAFANSFDNCIGVRVYCGHKIAEAALEQLGEQKDAIHNEIGSELSWNPNPDKRDKIIVLQRPADLNNRDDWPEYVDWMTKTILAFRAAFFDRVKRLDLSDTMTDDEEA